MPAWYHTLEHGPGRVVEGKFDMRRVERRGRFRLPSTQGFSVRCVVHHARP